MAHSCYWPLSHGSNSRFCLFVVHFFSLCSVSGLCTQEYQLMSVCGFRLVWRRASAGWREGLVPSRVCWTHHLSGNHREKHAADGPSAKPRDQCLRHYLLLRNAQHMIELWMNSNHYSAVTALVASKGNTKDKIHTTWNSALSNSDLLWL